MMKKILLFGAGKSATVLIDYLLEEAAEQNWELTVADANRALIDLKLAGRPHGKAALIDIQDEDKRKQLVSDADLVISMLSPA